MFVILVPPKNFLNTVKYVKTDLFIMKYCLKNILLSQRKEYNAITTYGVLRKMETSFRRDAFPILSYQFSLY